MTTLTDLLKLVEEKKRRALEEQERQKAFINQLFDSCHDTEVVSFSLPEPCVEIIESWCAARGIDLQEFYSGAIREKVTGLVADFQAHVRDHTAV